MSDPALLTLDRVGSTMDVLHELAEAGASAGAAVVAREQTGGRGSRGRSWVSRRGGLWLSLLYRPGAPAGLELLSLRIGLAVAEALEQLGAPPVGLKWPNDLMLGDRKLGGVLCEARWQGNAPGWVVAGLGLNVANETPTSLRAVATRLGSVLPGVTSEDLVAPLLATLRRIDPDAGPLTTDERDRFRLRDWLHGRPLRAPAAGVAAGLSADGALLVRLAAGATTAVRAGTIELADSLSPP
ncbi:MAG TPA: biotin--[acetyl-CoA-carboxylase] ligase [Gemmatimonadales bacterium]|nr:biotin--[acetyl-CoA-carboxylase] ligase [Gemmatimonadales bacterium]